MSYPNIEQDDFLYDLLKRKEFYSLKVDENDDYRDADDEYSSNYMKLRSYQMFIRNYMNPNTPYKRLHLMHGCHPKGTKILLYDMQYKDVIDILVGDNLMGPDGNPRTVLGLYYGEQQLYRVTLKNGLYFDCNESHILVLQRDGKLFDISVADVINNVSKYKAVTANINKLQLDYPRLDDETAFRIGIGIGARWLNVFDYIKYDRRTLKRIIEGILTTKYKSMQLTILCTFAGVRIVNNKIKDYDGLESFTITKLKYGEYYGFELDGDGRYLLYNFIITHNTGVGKTLAAVSVANEFKKSYKKIYYNEITKTGNRKQDHITAAMKTPNIFLLGFGPTKAAFIRELLKYPELGFITYDERAELTKRKNLADSVNATPNDINDYLELFRIVKRRIFNKSKDGFFKFYGYEEFVNRLFYSDSIRLVDIEHEAMNREDKDIEAVMTEYIKKNMISVNEDLLRSFDDSIIICDEIHNTYNSLMKNNRGVAIQYVLDTVPNVRFLSLSATPINNSPTEVVELINYLVDKQNKISKKELFDVYKVPPQLKPDTLDKIVKLLNGKISFLQDTNIKYFPTKITLGDTIITELGEIPYLKFIICPMSDLHQKTYENMKTRTEDQIVTEGEEIELAEIYDKVPNDGYCIYDMVFPNPDDELGLYRSNDIRARISSSNLEWRTINGIDIRREVNNYVITGNFLHMDNLPKYSTKYTKMIQHILDIYKKVGGNPKNGQKIMLYHTRVKFSGVLIIQEVLKANGILDEYSGVTDNTICCLCGVQLKSHDKTHDFVPARFVTIHSDIDIKIRTVSMDKYGAPDNTYGTRYNILLGSKLIKESYDFKSVRHLMIMSLPINIPTLIQVFGRCIRNGSHNLLPPDKRDVSISIFVSTNNNAKPGDNYGYELDRYILKLNDYKIIQKIEKTFTEVAVDANIHRGITMPSKLKETLQQDQLGYLYFEPIKQLPNFTNDEINLNTFNSNKYFEDEIKLILLIIKRLYIKQPVYTYDDLWVAVRSPPFGIEINPKMFSENNFIIALSVLLDNVPTIKSILKDKEFNFIERLFDYADRHIYIGDKTHKLKQIGEYYILFPIQTLTENPLNYITYESTSNIRDKERAMIKSYRDITEHILVDVDTFTTSTDNRQTGITVNINKFIKQNNDNSNYQHDRQNILKASTKTTTDKITDMQYKYLFSSINTQLNILSEIIIYYSVERIEPSEFENILDLLRDLNVIVTIREIIKYRDIHKQFANGVPKLPEHYPIGYANGRNVSLYDGKWFDISKVSINRQSMYNENTAVIGMLEANANYTDFKIRKPLDKIKNVILKDMARRETNKITHSHSRNVAKDTRLIERGTVCHTKPKPEILNALHDLGIDSKKIADIETKKTGLCSLLFQILLTNEIQQRKNKGSLKFLYGFWDEVANIHLIV